MRPYKKLNFFFFILFTVLIAVDFGFGISIWCYGLVVTIYLSVCVAGSFLLSTGFFLPVTSHGNRAINKVALSFDDGPIRGQTDRILDILKAHQVHATFFCIGARVKENPELLLKIANAGHLVGNHTYYHKNTFGFLSTKKVARELHDTDMQIANILGKKPRFFRPPYGVTNPMIATAITTGNYIAIGWSIRSFDTIIKDPARLFRRVTAKLSAGDIVLFHDYSNSMIEILPDFIQYIKQKGFQIAPLNELLNEESYR